MFRKEAHFVYIVDDEGAYYEAQKVNSAMVTNPIHIYFDLYNCKRRGRKRAQLLREWIIRI